jgi:hypothetical protein
VSAFDTVARSPMPDRIAIPDRLARLRPWLLAALVAAACGGGSPRPEPPLPTVPPNPLGGRNALLVIGDSLSVGTAPLLPLLLPDLRVRTDGLGGRPLAQGIRILSVSQIPPDGSTVLAFSLFTNDDPRHTHELEAAVRAALLAAGPHGCVVWATIARPPVHGVGYGAANDVLRRIAASDPRLRLVRWDEKVRAEPILLGPDGIHPTPRGYQVRAQMYAGAVRSCGPGS